MNYSIHDREDIYSFSPETLIHSKHTSVSFKSSKYQSKNSDQGVLHSYSSMLHSNLQLISGNFTRLRMSDVHARGSGLTYTMSEVDNMDMISMPNNILPEMFSVLKDDIYP